MTSTYTNPQPYNSQPPVAGPSIHHRQSSRDALGYKSDLMAPRIGGEGGGGDRSSGRFDDASDEEKAGKGSSEADFRSTIMAFDPPPARSSFLHTRRAPQPPRPPNDHRMAPSHPSQSTSTPPRLGDGTGGTNINFSPPRDRLPSSTSMSSMSSIMRGRRAPAPAALDLSPTSERVRAETETNGMRSTSARVDPLMDRATSQRYARPLPTVPNPTRLNIFDPAPPPAFAGPSIPARKTSFSGMTSSPSMPIVPLSAVGNPPRHGDRLSVAPEGSRSPLDPYSLQASPISPTYGNQLLSPRVPQSLSLSPSSPETIDPSNIDRRTLIGVGELSTPRWTSDATLRNPHQRTPSMPHDFGTSPPIPGAGANPISGRDWMQGQTGLGLGVGVMEGVKEESPQKSAPATTAPGRQLEKPQHSPGHNLLSLNTLPDFDFDSTMTAALAATLSVPDDLPPSPKINREHRASAPPAQSRPPQPPFQSQPPPLSTNTDLEAPNYSPGSARSRIYARRQSRQQASMLSSPADPEIPQRSSSQQSPPNSADPYVRRKTPPSSREGTLPKTRQSPSAAHHDILKHFAPKDFSHLPPSPSSASINQFLRGSGSVNNFASMGVGTPPGSTTTISTSYFGSQPGSTKSVQRSDSGKASSLKTGWEGKEVDPDTAEALRKLDGLSSTPGKSRTPKGRQSSGISSRPGTPPPTKSRSSAPPSEKKPTSKPSTGSLKSGESPLNNWIDLADDVPAVPVPPRGRLSKPTSDMNLPGGDKRESSSSTSFAGTPTSRDSQSLPTTSTTPSSSVPKADKAGRRASGGSEASTHSNIESVTDVTETIVPPVPPLPKGYTSMRQGLTAAYVPLQDTSSDTPPPEVNSPSSPLSIPSTSETSQASRPRAMNKKWSFSSALNLRSHTKESSSSPVTSPGINDEPRNLQTPWSELSIPSPGTGSGSEAESKLTIGIGTRSDQSLTPVGHNLAAPAPMSKAGATNNKRLTPSSIPFFRRTSSSSITKIPGEPSQAQSAPPPAAGPAPRNVSGGTVRKSVLGMSIPSMLRGNSKRTVSQQIPAQTVIPTVEIKAEPPQFASTGWTGRKRGKTLSISNEIPGKMSAPPLQVLESQTLRAKPSDGSINQRSSMQSNTSESTVHGGSIVSGKSGLPPIRGSPALRQPPSITSLRTSESPRGVPSATPTKIPRIARPAPESPATLTRGSMPPPSYPLTSSRSGSMSTTSRTTTMTNTSSMVDMKNISEFGSMNGILATPRQSATTSGSHSHRAHLLAPMSARDSRDGSKRQEKSRDPLVRNVSGQVIPPSRRHLPIPPPASTVTAQTASSIAKRASREFRPAGSRHGSNSGQNTPSENPSPIKPSKSLHSKLSVPSSTSRLPTSSSVGAPGTRKTSLVVDSPSVSPAEDDEAQADAEMEAYVKRRKIRHANGKPEDLTDINGFPDDQSPSEAQSQRAFVSRHLAKMSDYERKEVLDFDQIYYTPPSRIARPAQPNGASYNHGYDDERGDYLVVPGDHLCYRYEVVGTLGKGSFGQVVQCRDHKTGGSAAIKIIRNKKRFHAQALVEVKILQQLVEWDPEDRHYMVRMTDNFYFRGHLCIVTELLSINLYELIKANQFVGFSTVVIRRFTAQMLASLQLMRSHRIVHCDLKPENILLCHPSKSGIKVIDFGSSCLETEKVYTYIQSRFYRSPEVILGMNYAMAIDMWSLGCILAELYTGVPIFPGENEHEQLACIMEVLGVPDRYVIEKASRRKIFFDAIGAPRPFVNAKGRRRRPGTRTLAQVLKCDDELFVDFISKCLTWDPDKRLKPQPALRHPWILAGRRRQAPSAPLSAVRGPRLVDSSAGGSNLSSSSSSRDHGHSGSTKKSLLISPPTPLMAKTSQGGGSSLGGVGQRMGHSSSGSRVLSGSSQLRGSSFASPQKISLG